MDTRYNRGPEYNRAQFDVKVFVGPADLKFELWGKDGNCSKAHDDIEVEWDAPKDNVLDTGADESFGMYKP